MPALLRFNELKTTEAAALFLLKEKGKMRYLKLLQLLYLMDRQALAEWQRPITNDSYVVIKQGVVLCHTLDMIKHRRLDRKRWESVIESVPNYAVRIIESRSAPAISALSPAEVDLIDRVYAKYGRIDQNDIFALARELPDYQYPNSSPTPVPLEDILRALHYSPQDVRRIIGEMIAEAATETLSDR